MHDANRPDMPQAASVRAGAAARDAAPHGAGACPPCGGDVIPHGSLVQQRSPLVAIAALTPARMLPSSKSPRRRAPTPEQPVPRSTACACT